MSVSIKRRLGWCLATFILLAFGLEGWLRLAGFANPVLYTHDPDIGYLPKVNQNGHLLWNQFSYNKHHHRSDELLSEPNYRILLLGDSVSNGGQATDQRSTVSELLEKKLNDRLFLRGEVLNASVSGWGIPNEAAYLRKFGTFGSDIIIWQIGSADLGQPASVIGGEEQHPVAKPLTATGRFLKKYILPRLFRRRSGPYSSGHISGGRRATPAWDPRNASEMMSVMEVAHRDGVRLLVLMTPKRSELDKEASVIGKAKLTSLLGEHGIQHVDLLKSGRLRKKFYRDNIHFNEEGNNFVAEALFDNLTKAHIGLSAEKAGKHN